jgi:O-succinylbenzoic acid--CoA ligase
VPELVAIDVVQDDGFPGLLEAIWARGDAACVIDARLSGVALDAQLAALAPTRIVRRVDDELVEASVPGGTGVETGDALAVATSGSTAAPRAVVLTHDAVAASATATSRRLGVISASDRWLCCLPCAHVGGLSVVTRALLTSTPLEVHGRFDPIAVADAAARGATLVSLVATAMRRLLRPDAFRTIVLGGASAPTDRPDNAVVTWGMTETGSGVVYDGIPLDGVEVDVLDGELFVRCAMQARAYRDGEAIDAVGPDGTKGWLATGDAGTVTDGVVVVHGRVADVINTGGEKVWPDDVERVLSDHPRVAEVAVWRRADPEWGERVVAYVVAAGAPPTLDQLREHAAAQLPPWAAPKELVVLTSLPRGPSGKIVRRLLERSAHPA